METILVTGGAGYIGSKIAFDLIDNNYRVVIVDNLSTGIRRLIPSKSIFYKTDIKNEKKINEILKKHKIKKIIHLAASLSVPESMKDPLKYFMNNVDGTKKLLKICIKNKMKDFIFSSTCAIYGKNNNKNSKNIVNEGSKIDPKSIYGLSKYLCELIIEDYSKIYKFSFVNLRYFNVAGADIKLRTGCSNDNGQLFSELSKSSLKANPKITIYGNNYNTYDGTCIRDYIDVNDLSKIHLKVLNILNKKKLNIKLNCGNGKGFSVFQIVKTFRAISKKNIEIIYGKRRPGDIEKIIGSNLLLKQIVKNFKFASIKETVKTSILWEKKFKKQK